MPFDFHENVGKREAIVPEQKLLSTSLGDLRVDERSMVLKIDVNNLFVEPSCGAAMPRPNPRRMRKSNRVSRRPSMRAPTSCDSAFFTGEQRSRRIGLPSRRISRTAIGGSLLYSGWRTPDAACAIYRKSPYAANPPTRYTLPNVVPKNRSPISVNLCGTSLTRNRT